MLTQEQLELRRSGLTATDVPAILGLNPYRSAIDVLLDKQGLAAPFIDTDRVKWGNILEDPIRLDYAERHGLEVVVPGTLAHKDNPWAMATPDGIAHDADIYAHNVTVGEALGTVHGWECKTHSIHLRHLYGEPGTDEVPAYELVQCAWNCYVARSFYGIDINRWDLTAFMDGVPVDYHIDRDVELEEMMIEAARTFWTDHVQGGKPLEPDGSDSFSRYLARTYPNAGEEVVEADEVTAKAIERLRSVKEDIRHLEGEESKLVQQVKAAIGEAQAIDSPEGTVTWRKTKDSTRVDWKSVASEYKNLISAVANKSAEVAALLEGCTEIIEHYTTTKPGHRRFVTPRKWNK